MLRTTLAPDYSISRVIRGGWQLSAGHALDARMDRDCAIDGLVAFMKRGITTLDVGDIYIGVEEMVGAALRKFEQDVGAQARNMIQLHTKYVPDLETLATHRFADAEKIVHRSRKRFGVDQIDLVQFHWWDYGVPGYIEALQHLATLQQQGYIRLLGVTNFDVPRMRELMEAGIVPATLQVQYSVLDRRPEHGMVAFCRAYGIRLLCYGTVAGGFLSDRYLDAPEPALPLPNRSLVKYKLIIDECGGWGNFQKLLKALHHVAQKHNCSISCVASAYVLAKPQVAGVIVGARDMSHLEENLHIMRLQLDEEDCSLLERVLSDVPGVKGDIYALERNDPRHAGIMHKRNNREI